MRIFCTILIGLTVIDINAQINNKDENDSFLYWQPNARLRFEDFKGDTTTSGMDLCRKYNIHIISEVHIDKVLDVPKKKRKRGKLLEKAYIAPVFCKYCSFSIKQDSVEILHDQMYFDMAEFCARRARMKLDTLRHLMPGYGTYWLMFSTVTEDMDNLMYNMFGSYTNQMAHKDSTYLIWRDILDKGLERTKKFATRPEECHRLLNNIPIDNEYERSEFIGPPMKSNK